MPLPSHTWEGVLKVLWHANAPWTATGYGQQTRLFLPFVAEAHDVALSQNHGYAGGMSEWEGLKVYPNGFDRYGNDVIPSWADDHMHPDEGWIFALYDGWVFNNPALKRFHMACWAPVDHQPLPLIVAEAMTELNVVPVAMSRFGQDQFTRAGLEALYVPHGVDNEFFPRDRANSRELLQVPDDCFLVGMNSANKAAGQLHRKGFAEAFHAFTQMPDDAVLWVHAESDGMMQGWDLKRLASGFGIEDRVVFSNQVEYRLGFSVDWLAQFYSAIDVLLSPSYGEGFGVPIVEAQACGTPVIVTDFTAMSELLGDGWKVGGQVVWHEGQQAFWKIPNVGQLVQALKEAYNRPQEVSDAAVEFAEAYRPERVWEDHFQPVLENLRERINA